MNLTKKDIKHGNIAIHNGEMCFVAWQRRKGNQNGHKIPRRHLIVRVTHIQGVPSHLTTPLGPSRAPKAHQKHALEPKSSSLLCLVASQPILLASRPTFHHLQIAFAYRSRTATNLILGVAMVSRRCHVATNLVFLVSCWCRDSVASGPMLQILPTIRPTHAHFDFFFSILAIGCKIKGQDDSIG